jgi:hypothetical protein
MLPCPQDPANEITRGPGCPNTDGKRARDNPADRSSGDQVEPVAYRAAALDSCENLGAEEPAIATTRDRKNLKARVWTIERPDLAAQIDFAHGNDAPV